MGLASFSIAKGGGGGFIVSIRFFMYIGNAFFQLSLSVDHHHTEKNFTFSIFLSMSMARSTCVLSV